MEAKYWPRKSLASLRASSGSLGTSPRPGMAIKLPRHAFSLHCDGCKQRLKTIMIFIETRFNKNEGILIFTRQRRKYILSEFGSTNFRKTTSFNHIYFWFLVYVLRLVNRDRLLADD